MDDVHGYLAALNPSVLDVSPLFCFESVCLMSLFFSLVLCNARWSSQYEHSS